ncbi:Transcription initiation factor TFIID subunit 2 [Sparganum proliferum]
MSQVRPPFRRPYRLAHQSLCITQIDFSQQLVLGFTQLVIWPRTTGVRQIFLNVRQCRIHRVLVESADEHFHSSLDPSQSYVPPPPTDVPTNYTDPCLEISKRDCKLRTLDSFERRQTSVVASTDPDEGNGELSIRLPPAFLGVVYDLRPLLITVEFSLSKPKYGFQFVLPSAGDSHSTSGMHAFTSGPPNASRLWFPCIDCSEPCTWKIEITVDEDLVAIAPGQLLGPPQYTNDLRSKTYQFYMAQPVSAPYIGVAVGAFEIYPDPLLPNAATHFCPKGLLPLLEHTISSIAGIVEHYEAILASQFPFYNLKTVFVDRAFDDHQSFASFIVFSVDLLHSARIIDQAITTRRIFSFAVAQQFFGCALQMETWAAAWLPYGIAGYLSGLYLKRILGNNEYRNFIANEMHAVTNYEHTKHGVILDPSSVVLKSTYFSLKFPQVLSPEYLNVYIKKAHLVIRMLELRFGQPVLLQVFNKLFVLAHLSSPVQETAGSGESGGGCSLKDAKSLSVSGQTQPQQHPAVPPCLSDENQSNLLLSTDSFRRIISTVTGQDIKNFLDLWVYKPGHVRLFAKFQFNRKRNVVELELKQDLQSRSTLNYTGTLTAMLQELDGPFLHTFKLEEGRTSRDLPCHSKSRKHKKKKIPLSNGDEVEMDLGRIDADSPLLWLRLDPDLQVIRSIHTDQADYMWHLMLAHDRDCLGQLEAVRVLANFASPETRLALSNIVADSRVYFRVRTDACFALCRVANELAIGTGGGVGGGNPNSSASASSVLLPLFWQLYSSPIARGLIRQNDFSHLQSYFLQKAIVRAVATLRIQQVCPRDVLSFLVELNRYNDNSRNPYSDCYYRAEIIKAMKDTLTPAIVMRGVLSVSSLPSEARTVVEEVARCMNLDSQIPSYKNTVTVACLLAIRRLQRFSFVPVEPTIFYKAAASGRYIDVRLAALECLVDFVRGERDQTALYWLFENIIERNEGSTDSSHARLRYETVRMLLKVPPFPRGESGSRLDTPQLVDRLWNLMNSGCAGDSRLRCAVADLYFSLYGNCRPTCLPLPDGVLLVRVREGRSMLRLSEKDCASTDGEVEDACERLSDYEENSYTGRGASHRRRGSHRYDSNIGDEEDAFAPDMDHGREGMGELKRDNTAIFDLMDTPPKRRMEHLSDDDDDDYL